LAASYHTPTLVAQVVVGNVVFWTLFIVALILLRRIKKRVRGNEPELSLLSRVGGAMAGFAIGAVVFHLALAYHYLSLEMFNPPHQMPSYMQQSVSFPYVKTTARSLRGALQAIIPEPIPQ
jgi:hypothetical protein